VYVGLTGRFNGVRIRCRLSKSIPCSNPRFILRHWPRPIPMELLRRPNPQEPIARPTLAEQPPPQSSNAKTKAVSLNSTASQTVSPPHGSSQAWLLPNQKKKRNHEGVQEKKRPHQLQNPVPPPRNPLRSLLPPRLNPLHRKNRHRQSPQRISKNNAHYSRNYERLRS
jgi:hypothetical protein